MMPRKPPVPRAIAGRFPTQTVLLSDGTQAKVWSQDSDKCPAVLVVGHGDRAFHFGMSREDVVRLRNLLHEADRLLSGGERS